MDNEAPTSRQRAQPAAQLPGAASCIHSRVLLIVLLASLSACESLLGIKREAPLAGALDFQCVATTIRALEGISNVELVSPGQVRYELTGMNLDRRGRSIWTRIYTVHYRAGERLILQYAGFNSEPPIAYLESARPAMLRIEEALRAHCAFAPESSVYRDRCNVRACPGAT